MSVTTEDRKALAESIADVIRGKIESGDLAVDERLPPEQELAAQYGVSRDTIRRALVRLEGEGLLIAGRGRGRRVRRAAPLVWPWAQFERRTDHEAAYDGIDAWEAQVRALGREPSVKVTVEIAEPPAFVVDALQLGADDLAVVRKRVRFVDGTAYLIQDSWFPESLVRGTPLMRPRDVSAPGGVLASIGHVQVRYVDRISIRMPNSSEFDRLALPTGTPVAQHVRTGYDADGRPLRCMVSILPGDRHTLVYEVEP